MKKLKVAVAGLGFIGPAHIEALRRIPNIEVVAISDIDEETAKTKAESLGIEKYTSNFDELVKEDVDSIHICTPTTCTTEWLKKPWQPVSM
jgi:predicted dehydrogenase